MTYTIPKTQFKEMALTCNKDYDVLLAEVMKKAKPETVKISVAELKVRRYYTGCIGPKSCSLMS
jgi:hypothetical protein